MWILVLPLPLDCGQVTAIPAGISIFCGGISSTPRRRCINAAWTGPAGVETGWEASHTRGPGCLFPVGIVSEIRTCSVPALGPKGEGVKGLLMTPYRTLSPEGADILRRYSTVVTDTSSGDTEREGAGKRCCGTVSCQPSPSAAPLPRVPHTTCSMGLDGVDR